MMKGSGELTVRVTRRAQVPDPLRVARSARAPELGPRLLFLSGGSALRSVSRRLKHLSHNTVHLMTPFDSGGSSRLLRDAFDMLSVGDLRNRLLALADESLRGNPEIYRLLAYRLPEDVSDTALHQELQELVDGQHHLVAATPDPMRRLLRTQLAFLKAQLPSHFDLRGANVGNLLLAGGYLENGRDIQSVLYLFGKLLEARGIVHPITTENCHLGAQLECGEVLYGQHLLSCKKGGTLPSPVQELFLINDLETRKRVSIPASAKALKWIQRCDLICYPMGSFYSSVLCHLLPQGVGRAISHAACPKVFIANPGRDPEQLGLTCSGAIEHLVRLAQNDAPDAQVGDLVQFLLIDSKNAEYSIPLDLDEVERLGVTIIDTPLCSTPTELDGDRVSEALVSLC